MTVEEIIEEIDNEFQKENGYWLSTAIPIEFAAQVAIKFAKLKCQEQRQICADNAKVQKTCFISEDNTPTYIEKEFYFYPSGDTNIIKTNKNSILNAPAPEI